MKVSIHQPQYLPWIPYFTKISKSDVFVLLDDVQFQKNGLQNRNYIWGSNGETRLTLPVNHKLGDKINTVKVCEPGSYIKHWKTIEMNYRKAPFFEELRPALEQLYQSKPELLVDMNIALIRFFLDYAGIDTPLVLSSEMEKTGEKSDLILSICKNLGATSYLSGSGGIEYLHTQDFDANGIRVELMEYTFQEYKQVTNKGGFIPKLSALDLIMNEGRQFAAYL